MVGWSVGQLLSGKYVKVFRKEGFIRALLKGKNARHAQDVGGNQDVVPLVGMDRFGNKYYEDWHHDGRNSRRFVEYSDFQKWWPDAGKVPPEWHGWMHHQNDDAGNSGHHVDPFYKVDHIHYPSGEPHYYRNPGHILNADKNTFMDLQKERKYIGWQPPANDAKRQGKKIVVERQTFNE